MGFIRQTAQGSEYGANGYGVVVAQNGAINVKPGDSLSKYSMAIYGDFDNMDRKFGRQIGGQVKSFQELGANINMIYAGETVYQMNRHNTNKPGDSDESSVSPGGGLPPIPQSEYQRRLAETIRYIMQVYWIGSGWTVEGSDGIGIGVGSPGFKLGGALNGMRFWVKNSHDNSLATMWGVSVGGSGGLAPEPVPVDVTFSHHSFPSYGLILKSPTAGATLSKSELTGAFLSIEISGNLIVGGSVIAILTGPGFVEFFSNPALGIARTCIAKWLLLGAGTSVMTGADVSATASIGYMYAV